MATILFPDLLCLTMVVCVAIARVYADAGRDSATTAGSVCAVLFCWWQRVKISDEVGEVALVHACIAAKRHGRSQPTLIGRDALRDGPDDLSISPTANAGLRVGGDVA